jgi:hypothetical protein
MKALAHLRHREIQRLVGERFAAFEMAVQPALLDAGGGDHRRDRGGQEALPVHQLRAAADDLGAGAFAFDSHRMASLASEKIPIGLFLS